MAGRPKTRARREAELAAEAELASAGERLPDLSAPRIPDALWKQMSETEKVIACWGGNLDNIRDLISIPFSEADFHTRGLQVRVHEIGLKLVMRLLTEQRRDTGREEALSALAKALAERVVGDDAAPLRGFAGVAMSAEAPHA